MAIVLDDVTRRLLDGRNFATVATLNPDGGPQTSVVWILRDGDTVLFSAIATRRKVLNLARDPRISLAVFDVANPYQSVEIRGVAELAEDTGKWLPEALSHHNTRPGPAAGTRRGDSRDSPGETAKNQRLLGLILPSFLPSAERGRCRRVSSREATWPGPLPSWKRPHLPANRDYWCSACDLPGVSA